MQKVWLLNLNSDTFSSLKMDWDGSLQALFHKMEVSESEEAELNVKVKIKMKTSQTTDPSVVGYDAMRDVKYPTFDHKITSLLTMKSERKGRMGGDLELVWDKESHEYILVEESNGQTTFYEDEQEEYQPAEPLALPEAELENTETEENYAPYDYIPAEFEDVSEAAPTDHPTDYDYSSEANF